MKNVVKKLAITLTLLVTFGVQAQDRREKMKDATPEERIEMRANKMSEKLGLNEAQKKKVKEIFAEQQKENKEIRDKVKAEREKKRAEMKETMTKQHEELKAKLKPVLTKEQFEKWEAMQKENMDKVKERRKHKKE